MRLISEKLLLVSTSLALLLSCGSGCMSWFKPRSHKLINTAEEFAQSAVCPAAIPHELTEQPLAEYRVAAGDVILIEPADFEASVRLPGDEEVEADGTIQFGQYGQLHVAGMTLGEIRGEAEQAVSRQAERKVPLNVRLVEKRGQVYYVLGEVSSPGSYPLEGHETVLDALIKAGGINDQADRRSIILSKPSLPGECRVVLPICYRHIVQLGDTTTNYQMHPGDRIFVPSSSFWKGLGRAFSEDPKQCPQCGPVQEMCPTGMPLQRGCDFAAVSGSAELSAQLR
jgi:protein involved in polysaccharide export with SLBB domain